MNIDLRNGNCLDLLKQMPDNSVDSIVTDPPYGLSFMGKKWDYDVPSVDIWRECLRVLKPGGHLLSFAGTRTQHRMAVNIEDAGFEIRDMIAWVYGSGFPKSLDVSKAIDKMDAVQEQQARRYRFTEWVRSQGVTSAQINEATGTNMGGHYTTAASQPAIMTREHLEACRHLLSNVPKWVEQEADIRSVESKQFAERKVVGETRRGAQQKSTGRYGEWGNGITPTAPATPEAQQWDGWGTALKPALEPITVARKPFKGTVANNVLEWGTGAINIDGCRVGTETVEAGRGNRDARETGIYGRYEGTPEKQTSQGRWPANLIHDGSEEVVGLFPETKSGGGNKSRRQSTEHNNCYGNYAPPPPDVRAVDKGSAARFFYCAKASKKDRDEGLEGFEKRVVNITEGHGMGEINTSKGGDGIRENRPRANVHPTVKPTDLMRYLVRLVTPPSGTVLDPFMGSGSTGKAAKLEGFNFIGIELDAEYIEIAKARIEAVSNNSLNEFLV